MPKKKENVKIMKENTTRVVSNVPNDIVAYLKDCALKRGITMSAMVNFALAWYVDYSSSLEMMPKVIELLKNPTEILNNEQVEKTKTKE